MGVDRTCLPCLSGYHARWRTRNRGQQWRFHPKLGADAPVSGLYGWPRHRSDASR